MRFLDHGRMHDQGLALPGIAGGTEIFEQDGSVLGWSCGNLAASAQDVARFYFDLLGNESSPIVSKASRGAMMATRPLDTGWARGYLEYGSGLMIETVDPKTGIIPAQVDTPGAYIGHGGETYGFLSEQGWFPSLNLSMSAVAAQTATNTVGSLNSHVVMCRAAEIVSEVLYDRTIDLNCTALPPAPAPPTPVPDPSLSGS